MKSSEFDLPICNRFEEIKNNLYEYGLTFLETNSIEISYLTDSICKAKTSEYPKNLTIVTTVDDRVTLRGKKDLRAEQRYRKIMEISIKFIRMHPSKSTIKLELGSPI